MSESPCIPTPGVAMEQGEGVYVERPNNSHIKGGGRSFLLLFGGYKIHVRNFYCLL